MLLGAVVLYAFAALAYGALRRRRRRAHAVEPRARIALAWEESLEQLELVGVVRKQSETHTEFAHRAGRTIPERTLQLDELASLADVVTYAPDAIDDSEADTRRRRGHRDRRHRSGARAASKVWLSRLDPRTLLPRLDVAAEATGAILQGLEVGRPHSSRLNRSRMR